MNTIAPAKIPVLDSETDKDTSTTLSITPPKPHFGTMDGLRGVAAMLVVLFHSYEGGGIVPNAPLAVDFFFMLSGFVIANAYEYRLAHGLGSRAFLLRRFARLYPMLFVGAFGGGLLALIHNYTSSDAIYPMKSLLSSVSLSLFVLPYLAADSINNRIFSFNPPIWSLFFEIIANIFYAFFSRFLTKGLLIAIVATGVLGVCWLGLGGGSKEMFWTGFPRVAGSFFSGILMFRLWLGKPQWRRRMGIGVLSTILLGLSVIPIAIDGWLFLPAFAVMSSVMWLAAGDGYAQPNRFFKFLGSVSYPTYLIHWLTLYLFTFIGRKAHLTGGSYVYVVIVHLAAVPFIGYAVSRLYENPARLMLERLFGIKKSA